MPVTDPVADMLTRIRNALVVKMDTVDMPASKMKIAIAKILLREGFIKGCEVIEEGVQGTIGIIGPKRMDYKKVVNNLETVMTQLDTIFKKDKKE